MTSLFGELLVTRARTHRHDRWTRTQLDTYQQRMLARLRDHASRRSPFYADQHRGMQSASLSQLPPLTKTQLMAHWDRLVTSPVLRLDSVTHRLQDLESLGGDPGQPWQGRWWTAATAGSTGQRGVFVWNRREWINILSSYARVNDWAQVKVGPRRPVPTAIVSTRNPAHQSAVVGASLRNPLVPTLRLDATQPIADLVEALNRFQPRLLVCYASMLTPLAEAQTAGNLHISPEKVITASEEQLPPARRAAIDAWGVQVIDTYAATETATIASTCSHGSMHLYEDFVIIEPATAELHSRRPPSKPSNPGVARSRLRSAPDNNNRAAGSSTPFEAARVTYRATSRTCCRSCRVNLSPETRFSPGTEGATTPRRGSSTRRGTSADA